jgi:transcriptional regulator with XRE-family HTH domain
MKKKKIPPKSATSIDNHFGRQIRSGRLAINMTQTNLGEKLGISTQQVQKYEAGINRITAARLYEICRVFGVPIASMFEGIPRAGESPGLKAKDSK